MRIIDCLVGPFDSMNDVKDVFEVFESFGLDEGMIIPRYENEKGSKKYMMSVNKDYTARLALDGILAPNISPSDFLKLFGNTRAPFEIVAAENPFKLPIAAIPKNTNNIRSVTNAAKKLKVVPKGKPRNV